LIGASIGRAYNAFGKNSFGFIWASLLCAFMIAIGFFASLGIFLIYFVIASAASYPILEYGAPTIPTGMVLVVSALFFLFIAGGFNGALAMAYRNAAAGYKTSLGSFYSHALKTAGPIFGITVVRDLVWLVFVGSALGLSVFALQGQDTINLLIMVYAFFMTFIIHFLFTPAILSAATMGLGIVPAIKRGFTVVSRFHVMLLVLYGIFAFCWLLNLIPIIGLLSIFILYPLSYSTLLVAVSVAGGRQ